MRDTLNLPALRRALLASAAGTLALLLPLPPLPQWKWLFNLGHVPLLATLGYLWLQALCALGQPARRAGWLVLGGGALLGAALELLQFAIPGRWPDLQDFLLNLLGLLIGTLPAWRQPRSAAGSQRRNSTPRSQRE